jgi:hypothetical protein
MLIIAVRQGKPGASPSVSLVLISDLRRRQRVDKSHPKDGFSRQTIGRKLTIRPFRSDRAGQEDCFGAMHDQHQNRGRHVTDRWKVKESL